MSKLYRGPSIDASYQVSVHLAKGFQRRRLKCEKLTDDRRRTPSDGKRVNKKELLKTSWIVTDSIAMNCWQTNRPIRKSEGH